MEPGKIFNVKNYNRLAQQFYQILLEVSCAWSRVPIKFDLFNETNVDKLIIKSLCQTI